MILRAGSAMTYRKKCRNVEQSITGKERGKWKIMRNRFDRQLQVLNDELIEMGSLDRAGDRDGMFGTGQTGCGESAESDQL